MNSKDFYYCYSIPLKKYLKEMGFNFIIKALHPITNKPFFMYEKTNNLDMTLRNWSNNK